MNERTSFLRSIRLRLSAWYALFLFLTVVLLGILVTVAAEQRLRDNLDERLARTSREVTDLLELDARRDRFVVILPPEDRFAFRGQLIQVADDGGDIQYRSENLEGLSLPIGATTPEEIEVIYATEEFDNVSMRVVTDPIVLSDPASGDRVIGTVVVAESLAQLEESLSELQRLFIIAALVGALLAALAGWFIAGRTLTPVDEMTATARRLAEEGDATSGVAQLDVPDTGDELARLGSTFNDLLAKQEAAVNAQRQFVADASHELRTPLTALRGNIDFLQRQLDQGSPEEHEIHLTVDELSRESSRMSRLIEDLLTLARSESETGLSLQIGANDLVSIVGDAVRSIRSSRDAPPIDVDLPSTLSVWCDRDRIEQVVLNLLDNATRHAGRSGRVMVRAETDGRGIGLSVSDTGPGLSPTDSVRVFDRFYRSDTSRDRSHGGTGLGLAIAQAIMNAHGGSISVSSVPGEGAIFTIELLDELPDLT